MPDFSKTYFYPRRSRVVWAFWAVVLLGIPFWYWTTYTYRATLPHEEMEAWEEWRPRQPSFPVHVTLEVEEAKGLDLEGLAKGVEAMARQRIQEGLQADADATASIQLGLDLKVQAREITIHGGEERALKAADSMGHPGSYTLYLYPLASSSPSTSMVIGKGRGAVVRLHDYHQTSIIRTISSILVGLSSQEGKILQRTGQSQGSGKSHDQEGTGQSVMMRWAPTYQVLFSLMVEDPRERVYGWDIGTALDEWLSPFLRRLGHTSHLEITTQVQYFTTPLIQPYYQGQSNSTSEQAHSKEYWYYEEGQLPGLIDTTNWQLASTISQAPALHLLLFLPAKAHRPLHIHTHGGGILAETDAFLIPQWGGIVLHQLEENTSPQLSSTELEPVLSIFRSQLRDLLGVQPLKAPGLEGDAQIIIKEAGEEGITGWEEDRMLRMRMVETMRKAASTLGSLSRSVQSLEHMPVQDAIRYRVEEALEWMHKACDASEEGRVAEAFQASSKAFVLSEEAFFDKDMVAMLYFPDEHKYAVYMPLFIPIAVPLLLALVQEIKWWKESRSGRGDRDTSKAKVE